MKIVLVALCCVQACLAASIGSGASCSMMFCTQQYDPVCGSDGQTYSNGCFLGIAQCKNPGLTMSRLGSCSGSGSGSIGLPKVTCPPVACFALWDPVCGSDGVTYSNTCTLNAKNCGSTVITMAHRGACGGTSIG